MPGSYCDFEITSLARLRGLRGASAPFAITAERLRLRLQQLRADGPPDDGVLFPELTAHWQEADSPPGCVVFGQYPSADTLLLVTAGDLRGSVWCGVCYGIAETDAAGRPVGFLAWFAGVLAELEGGV